MSNSAGEYAFLCEWEKYLRRKRHRMVENSDRSGRWHLIRSQDQGGNHYVWVIMFCLAERKRFSKNELLALEAVARAAGQCEAQTFVVVKFSLLKPKVVVAGAEFVLDKKVVSADVGGINWR